MFGNHHLGNESHTQQVLRHLFARTSPGARSEPHARHVNFRLCIWQETLERNLGKKLDQEGGTKTESKSNTCILISS